MQSTLLRRAFTSRLAALVLLAVSVTGCSIQSQGAPELSGPSELADADACKNANGGFCTISIAASPDRLPQDGNSQSVITATVLDEQGRPKANLSLRWIVTASDGSQIVPSAQITATDAQGRASTVITAPAAPPEMPANPLTLRVEVEPISNNSQEVFNSPDIARRSVVVELVPPAGLPLANRNPVALFVMSPVAATVNQTVTFNASTTTDEGVLCGTRCTYQWLFVGTPAVTGRTATDSGMVVTRQFAFPDTYTVTLTVTDERGGVGSRVQQIVVSGPSAPVATFVVTPNPATQAQQPVTFNAAASSVGVGATITQYEWDFNGDGATDVTTAAQTVTQSFTPGTYVVRLTITDNLGRTATAVTTLVVTP